MSATWRISVMNDLNVYAGHDRVIVNLHWDVIDSAETDAGETVHVRIYGSQGLQPLGDLDPFTAWADVTETQAIGWLHDRMGADQVAETEANLDAQLQAKLHPTESKGVPW